MRFSLPTKALLAAIAAVVLLTVGVWARNTTNPPSDVRLAAAFQLGGNVDWRQWDSFLTTITKRFGQDLGGDLRDNLVDIFLDARHDLLQALSPSQAGAPNLVPTLFLNTMSRFSPLLRQAVPDLPRATANNYSNFASAVDGLVALGQIGFQLGFTNLSPDALRGLARMVEPSAAVDPLAYTVDLDPALRTLLGFGAPLPSPKPNPAVEESRVYPPWHPFGGSGSIHSQSWFVRTASAAGPDNDDISQWTVPDSQKLQPYLVRIRDLLIELGDEVLAKSPLAEEYRPLYRNIVLTAAWQESCWRQFIKKGEKLAALSSVTGDLGLMQINRNVWRGVYDIKGLTGDIEYNGRAGGEILYHYLTRYAIRKGEDKKPEGHLARATYAAYNGGPGALTRYRAAKRNPALKKVDDAFWEKFQAVDSGREMEVARCYGG